MLQTWQDFCSKTKAKSSKIKKYTQQTGGGPSLETSEQLTSTEEQVLETLDLTAIHGHDTIAETGALFVRKKSYLFYFIILFKIVLIDINMCIYVEY